MSLANPWIGEYEEYVKEICEKLRSNSCEGELVIDPFGLSDEHWRMIAAAMKENTSLKKLEIYPEHHDPVEMSVSASLSIAAALLVHRNLEHLSLCVATFAEFNAIALAIVQNKKLNRLTIEYSHINASLKANLTLLLKENALESLTLDEIQLEGENNNDQDQPPPIDLPGAFGDNHSLKELAITAIDLDDGISVMTEATLRDIALMLRVNQGIESLHLGPCPAEGHSHIARAVRGHSALEELVFIGCEETTEESVESIAGMLTKSSALRDLNLTCCHIGDEGARQLASGLTSENCLLERLVLSQSQFSDTRVVPLAAALERNTTIEVLSLYDNSIGDTGAVALATALTQNQTLTSLDINCNRIGREGAAAIAGALTTNTSLQTLQMDFNPIGDGMSSVARALRDNHSLRSLHIGNFGEKGWEALIASIPHMRGLKSLRLKQVEDINSETASAFLNAMERNTTLESFDTWNLGRVNQRIPEIMPRVNRIMSLNRAGRRILRSQAEVPRSLWPCILGRSSCNNLEAIYFFLQQNPHLFKRQTVLGKRKRGHSGCTVS